MRRAVVYLLAASGLVGCSTLEEAAPIGTKPSLLAAEDFIDSFYSFDQTRLRASLASAQVSLPKLVYYQGWAEGGNYEIVKRERCVASSPEQVTCAIKVKDDLIAALGLSMNVTDTFHLSLEGGKIVAVRTSSNDPQMFRDAQQWVRRERPELIRIPCERDGKGGRTPGECVKAMVRGFAEFRARGT